MQFPSPAVVTAFFRHVVSYVMGAVTVGAALHFFTPEQASQLTAGITNIVSGISTAAGGIATVIAILSGVWAAWTATPKQQLLSVAENPDVRKIVAVPSVAAATPSPKVVAN